TSPPAVRQSPRSIRRCGAAAFAPEGRTPDQHDAFCIAAWLERADRDGTLAGVLKPDLPPAERAVAQVEGWILSVPGVIRVAGQRKVPPTAGLGGQAFLGFQKQYEKRKESRPPPIRPKGRG